MSGCATSSATPAYPEAKLYNASSDATAQIDAALARAETSGRKVLIAFGGNWCHDSLAFAGWSQTPRIAALLADNYEPVFVDVGMPRSGDGQNLHIARRFGLDGIEGTPTVLVLTASGTALNLDSAESWRNTAMRTEHAILAELTALANVAE